MIKKTFNILLLYLCFFNNIIGQNRYDNGFNMNIPQKLYTAPDPTNEMLYLLQLQAIAEREQEEKEMREFMKNLYKGTLHLYGGKSHQIYLGCLNCPKNDELSMWNVNGKYSNSLENISIWNSASSFGAAISDYSPWTINANYPPVIVDFDGNFYGYFTVTTYFDKRTDIDWIISILEDSTNPTLYQDIVKSMK